MMYMRFDIMTLFCLRCYFWCN